MFGRITLSRITSQMDENKFSITNKTAPKNLVFIKLQRGMFVTNNIFYQWMTRGGQIEHATNLGPRQSFWVSMFHKSEQRSLNCLLLHILGRHRLQSNASQVPTFAHVCLSTKAVMITLFPIQCPMGPGQKQCTKEYGDIWDTNIDSVGVPFKGPYLLIHHGSNDGEARGKSV